MIFANNFARNHENAWKIRRLVDKSFASQLTSKPAYYIVDWRIVKKGERINQNLVGTSPYVSNGSNGHLPRCTLLHFLCIFSFPPPPLLCAVKSLAAAIRVYTSL